eukprot:TRINITY_DN1591_c1_g1_i3.p1 TRINITY_DN1591_c1_g1~~TRINITY_DN1591_c1_g1_i3.p1  ORF type:complete len:1033 (-),score=365.48 TRINITY_DN1591_c1_g1_i3:341-3439(-)
MASSDSDAGERRFRRTTGAGAGAAAGRRQPKRRARKTVESALKHALESMGHDSSSDEAPRRISTAPSVALSETGSASVPLSETGAPSAPTGFVPTDVKPKRGRKTKMSQAEADAEAAEASGLGPPRKLKRSASELAAAKLAELEPEADFGMTPGKAKKPAKMGMMASCMAAALDSHKGMVRKRDIMELTKARVNSEITPEKEGQDEEEISPDAELRYRFVGGGGGRGKRGKREDESGTEDEPEDDEVAMWEKCLEDRRKAGSEDLRTAFNLKECPAAAIRKLPAASFLGGKRLEDGGMLLHDDEGKLNVHFLLGTFAALKKRRAKKKDGWVADAELDAKHSLHIRWLIRKARDLRLVDLREVRLGKVAVKRMEAARKSGQWSLCLEANLVDNDAAADDGADVVVPQTLSFKDISFPELVRTASAEELKRKEEEEKEKLRQRFRSRQSEIKAASSHKVDIGAVKEKLLAPTFSFDWANRAADSEEEEDALEVEVPEELASQESRRALLTQHLKRSVSFHQAKQLGPKKAKGGINRSASNLSLGGASSVADLSQSQPEPSAGSKGAQQSTPTSAAQSGSLDSIEAAAQRVASGKLWRMLEAEDQQTDTAAQTAETPDAEAGSATVTAADGSKGLGEDLSDTVQIDASEVMAEDPLPKTGSEKQEARGGGEAEAEAAAAAAAAAAASKVAASGPAGKVGEDVGTSEIAKSGSTQPAAANAEDALEISPTLPFKPTGSQGGAEEVQITPTAPFKPAGEDLDISPTMPFRADVQITPTAPFKAGDADLQISPTLPHKHPSGGQSGAAEVQITPTAPFKAAEADSLDISPTLPHKYEAPAGTSQVQITPTAPFKAADDEAEAAFQKPAAAAWHAAQDATAAAATTANTSRKRAAEQVGAGSGQESKIQPLDLEDDIVEPTHGDSDVEMATQTTERELEWLKHKRTVERKQHIEQVKAAKLREEKEAKAKAKTENQTKKLGAATMSTTERERFEGLIASAGTGAATAPAQARAGGSAFLAQSRRKPSSKSIFKCGALGA